jgi:hypothetical protein
MSKVFEIESVFTTGVFIRVDKDNYVIDYVNNDAVNATMSKKLKDNQQRVTYRPV